MLLIIYKFARLNNLNLLIWSQKIFYKNIAVLSLTTDFHNFNISDKIWSIIYCLTETTYFQLSTVLIHKNSLVQKFTPVSIKWKFQWRRNIKDPTIQTIRLKHVEMLVYVTTILLNKTSFEFRKPNGSKRLQTK